MATSYNIAAVQGSTLIININASDSNGNYLNLNGYNARGFVKESYSSTGYLLNLNPQIDPSYVSGLIIVSGSAENMANMPVGIFVYDIEVSGGNNVFKPIKGYFSVDPEVSSF